MHTRSTPDIDMLVVGRVVGSVVLVMICVIRVLSESYVAARSLQSCSLRAPDLFEENHGLQIRE
jgi:hypothetical protein